MSTYRVAPIFLIRAAGVPFDHLEKLATRETAGRARELLIKRERFAEAKAAVEVLLNARDRVDLSEELFRAWRTALRSGTMPPPVDEGSGEFAICWRRAQEHAEAEAALKTAMELEISAARAALIQASRSILPSYLVFGAPSVRGLLARQLADYPAGLARLPPRNKAARQIEQRFLLYLQRVAAKNDTFSKFGPSAWGRAKKEGPAFDFTEDAPVAQRELFLERWTAHAMAAVMNTDDEIFPELTPRLNPDGRVEDGTFVFLDSGQEQALTAEELELIKRSDLPTPAHRLGSLEVIRRLVEKKILRCEVEVPAVEAQAFDQILKDVENWRPGPGRDTWLPTLQSIAGLRDRFESAGEIAERAAILDEGRDHLEQIGARAQAPQRFLYAASNAIGEECFRDCDVTVRDDVLQEVAAQAAPWIDFWRDSYAFVAGRVAAGLRQILQANSEGAAVMPLPAFLRACEGAGLPLTRSGLVALATMAFQEVKAAFLNRLRPHAGCEEYQLTVDDCHVVRNTFQYQKFDEYTYPSADLQILAESREAVAAGNYEWMVSELHPPIALLHHGGYWSCPDKARLNQAFAETVLGRPSFHFGFFAVDFTAHTTVRIFDALGKLVNFVAPQRGNPEWRCVPPAETEVYVDAELDVCVRRRDSREHLGSFARGWLIPLGFHPFYFGAPPHLPRLRCGSVIVQRRSWTLEAGEFPAGKISGVSVNLLLGVEKLRAKKGWPRHIYIRPSERALRRSGAEGRDKDTKPVYIDLESYLSLEIFHRWLVKSGELEITEMLPDPRHLLWQESDGRRTFELRTQIVPG